jgi:outer membrane biogenesis lipoprotein LolB
MMKKLLGISTLLAALLLSACATTHSATKEAPYSDVNAAVESN